MRGHIRERGKGHWYAIIDTRDAITGKRKRKWHSLKAKGKREAQMAALLEALKHHRIYTPALLAVLCGLRRGEIAALRWRNVDLENSSIAVVESVEQMNGSVRLKETKSGRVRTVALPSTVRDEL